MDEKQETIADILEELRSGEYAPLADRLEAAWKREKAAIEADALAVGGLIETSRATTENSSAVGDAAKLREALKAVRVFLDGYTVNNLELRRMVDAALAEPPRNCDVALVADGPADNNADKAWFAFKRHNPDAYFDVPGLLRCIDWLFAPATRKEGGNDGR